MEQNTSTVPHMRTSALTAAVTAVAFVPNSQFILACVGPYLRLYSLDGGERAELRTELRFPVQSLHGIRNLREQEDGSPSHFTFLVFGGRCAGKVDLEVSPTNTQLTLQAKYWSKDWILDARVCRCQLEECSVCPATSPLRECVVIGTAHNTVEVWDTYGGFLGESLSKGCEDSSILYCMALQGDALHSLLISAGTVFNQVLLWEYVSEGRIQHRIYAHDGVLNQITWMPYSDTPSFSTVSDDRTLRTWSFSPTSNSYEQSAISYGHSSRVWVSLQVSTHAVASGGEDGTVRLWDNEGNSICSISDHESSVQSLSYSPQLGLIASGSSSGSLLLHWIPSDFPKGFSLTDEIKVPCRIARYASGSVVLAVRTPIPPTAAAPQENLSSESKEDGVVEPMSVEKPSGADTANLMESGKRKKPIDLTASNHAADSGGKTEKEEVAKKGTKKSKSKKKKKKDLPNYVRSFSFLDCDHVIACTFDGGVYSLSRQHGNVTTQTKKDESAMPIETVEGKEELKLEGRWTWHLLSVVPSAVSVGISPCNSFVAVGTALGYVYLLRLETVGTNCCGTIDCTLLGSWQAARSIINKIDIATTANEENDTEPTYTIVILAVTALGGNVWSLPSPSSGTSVPSSLDLRATHTAVVSTGAKTTPFTAAKLLLLSGSRCAVVCGDRRGNVYIFDAGVISTVSPPSLSIDESPAVLEATTKLYHVHEVNAVERIFSSVVDPLRLYSVSKDGHVVRYRIKVDPTIDSLCLVKTLSLPSRPLRFTNVIHETHGGSLILGGLIGDEFVLWNFTESREVMRFHYGGGVNKPFAAYFNQNSSGFSNFVIGYSPLRSSPHLVLYSSLRLPPADSPSSSVVGAFGQHPPRSLLTSNVATPFHSRLSTSVRTHRWPQDASSGNPNSIIVLTSSEDNTIKVSSLLDDGPMGKSFRVCETVEEQPDIVRCLSSLEYTHPVSGTRGLLVFSGGRDELFQSFFVSPSSSLSHRFDIASLQSTRDVTGSRSQVSNDADSVTIRYSSIEVLDLYSEEAKSLLSSAPSFSSLITSHSVLLCLTTMAGVVRIVLFNPVEASFLSLVEVQAHQYPILSSSLICDSASGQYLLFTGDTRGCIRCWSLVDVVRTFAGLQSGGAPSTLSQVHILEQCSQVWKSPLHEVTVHQSGVNALAVLQPFKTDSVHSDRVVLVSGGDDECLGLLSFSLSSEVGSDKWLSSYSHTFVENAHFSAVKSLVGHKNCVYSSGYDQVLRTWVCNVDADTHTPQLVLESSARIDIPDPASSSLFLASNDSATLIVCGQGAQAFDVTLSPSS